MNQIKVVGHRGVRGIDAENTKSALLEAVHAGADAVEFDVRLTRDKQLVLSHNRSLKKVYGVNEYVDRLSLAELQKISDKNGQTIPTLQEVLDLKIPVPLLMDIKNHGSADLVYKIMSAPKNRHITWMVTTFLADEAARFKELDKNIWVSLGTVLHPLATIKQARTIGAQAITINVALLNVLDYMKARRAGLSVMLYMNYLPFMLTTPWIVRLFRTMYPGIIIITDRPDKIVPVVKG